LRRIATFITFSITTTVSATPFTGIEGCDG
jgi:hypothetical protein